MTDNETIKALECCKKAILHQDCLDLKCPYAMEFGCNIDKENLRNMALDLINRLKAENELKTMDVESLTNERNALEEMVAEQQAEIERLEDAKNAYKDIVDTCEAGAIKELAARLKETEIDIDVSYGYGREHYTKAVPTIVIDNLLAELTPAALTKLDHSSLCETETYEGDLK